MASSRAAAPAWATAELARWSIEDLAHELSTIGVRLLAFKGVHLAFTASPGTEHRAMCDADALVVEGSYERALAHLRSLASWHVSVAEDVSTMVRRGPRGFPIDLHASPFPRYFGRMSPDVLNQRAVAGPPGLAAVVVPDDVDAAAITVAHYVKDRFRCEASARIDLQLLAGRVSMADLAHRMREHGMRRIGLVGLTALGQRDSHYLSWLPHFTTQIRERAWARAMVVGIRRLATPHPRASWWLTRTAQDRCSDAIAGVAFQMAEGLRRRLFPTQASAATE